MSILKYKDPKTGEFKRINPYKADLTFVGKDGIVVNKAANSEKVEISGSGCVQKNTTANGVVYGIDYSKNEVTIQYSDNESKNTIAQRTSSGEVKAVVSGNPTDNTLINKKYVADNYVEKVKFTNLEQALNGYILDTTKEAYADLDSAVLKNSVAVGDNVYPIADKTRALVSRIEGKTTKMVQLLDKGKFPATSNPITGVTVTKTDDGGLHVLGTTTGGGGRNSWGITVKIEKGHKYLSLLKGNNKLTTPMITLKSNLSQYFSISDIKTSTIEGECLWGFNVSEGDYDETIYPQLFDLTAMNREDITTVEQFKAEFPELYYPYENGNLYPAKISGVKFYENQDKSGEQASVTLPETYDLHGIGDYKDYLEITKNENNELYTLKKVQNIGSVDLGTLGWNYGNNQFYTIKIQSIHSYSPSEVADIFCAKYTTTSKNAISSGCISSHESDRKYITIIDEDYTDSAAFKESLSGVMLYYALATPVETVIATNFTYEQMTAVRHNGGLIEVEGNTNKGYARPTVKNTIVYRLTATNVAEG